MQYVIKKGDTLSQIALDHGVTVDDILAVNLDITNKNLIRAGGTINVPIKLTTVPKLIVHWWNRLKDNLPRI